MIILSFCWQVPRQQHAQAEETGFFDLPGNRLDSSPSLSFSIVFLSSQKLIPRSGGSLQDAGVVKRTKSIRRPLEVQLAMNLQCSMALFSQLVEFNTCVFAIKKSILSEAPDKKPQGTEQKDPEGTLKKDLEKVEKDNKAEPSQLDDNVEEVELLIEEGEEEENMTDDEETEPTPAPVARELFPQGPVKVGEDTAKVEAPKEVEPRKVEKKVEEKVPKEPRQAEATGKPLENSNPKDPELTKGGKVEAEKEDVQKKHGNKNGRDTHSKGDTLSKEATDAKQVGEGSYLFLVTSLTFNFWAPDISILSHL